MPGLAVVHEQLVPLVPDVGDGFAVHRDVEASSRLCRLSKTSGSIDEKRDVDCAIRQTELKNHTTVAFSNTITTTKVRHDDKLTDDVNNNPHPSSLVLLENQG